MEHWFICDLMDSSGSQLFVWDDFGYRTHGSCIPLTLAGEETATPVFLCERPLNFLA